MRKTLLLAFVAALGIDCGGSGNNAVLSSPQPAPAFVVTATRVSPTEGTFLGKKPFFREPFLLLTRDGHLVTVFMEIPPTNDAHRYGWSCISTSGLSWSCNPISRGAGGTDFADAWITDSRGDACPTYGGGLTLAALRASSTNTLEPIAYYSHDFGRTWIGPERLPWPPGLLADGSKVLFTGRLYFGWRDFTFLTGQYVSRLGVGADSCLWSQPNQNLDGQDHIRLAATPEVGGFASLGNIGTSVFTLHRWAPDFTQTQSASVAAGPVVPGEPIYTFCKTNDPSCAATGTTGYELSRTLMYDPHSGHYHLLFSDRPSPDDFSDIETFHTFSSDGGVTWSKPVPIAGAGAPFSDATAASFEEQLVLDENANHLLAVYYEKPSRESDIAEVRYRVLQADGSWSRPVIIDQTPYATPGNEMRFGDYFGAQASDGILHVVDHPVNPADHFGYISYLAVRY